MPIYILGAIYDRDLSAKGSCMVFCICDPSVENVSVIFLKIVTINTYFYIFTGFSEKQGNMAASAPSDIPSEWDI